MRCYTKLKTSGYGPAHQEFLSWQLGMVSQPMVGKDEAQARRKFIGNRCQTAIGKLTPYFENGPTAPKYLNVVPNSSV